MRAGKALAVSLVLVAALMSVARAETPTCLGLPVTIVADPEEPETVGTPGNDVILGSDEKDVISALGGNDFICGGAGNDKMDAGPGSDRIDPGDGNDKIDGNDGRDVLDFGTAPGPLRYRIVGHDNVATIADPTTGKKQKDRIANGSIEEVWGSPFDDYIIGGFRTDTILGGAGDDVLNSIRGNPESLYGETGDDTFIGNGGGDTFFGDAGTDLVSYLDAHDPVRIDLAAGTAEVDYFSPAAPIDTLFGIENATGTDVDTKDTRAFRADIIKGDNGRNVLIGGDGDDEIDGRGGNDELYGQDGFDLLITGPGNDVFDGGPNPKSHGDVLIFSSDAGNIEMSLLLGVVTQDGEGGFDLLAAVEDVEGSLGSNRIDGDNGPNEIRTNNANDIVHGLGGDDTVLARSGADAIFGENGDDELVASQGSADGGPGSDGCQALVEVACERDPNY